MVLVQVSRVIRARSGSGTWYRDPGNQTIIARCTSSSVCHFCVVAGVARRHA